MLPFMERSLKLEEVPRADRKTAEWQKESQELGFKLLSLGGFNWAAALLGPAWFAYRNMQKFAIGFMVYMVILFGLMAYFEPSTFSYGGSSFGGGNKSAYGFLLLFLLMTVVLTGFAANSIYFRHLNMSVKNDSQLSDLQKYAGVNIVKLFAFFVAEIVLENKIEVIVRAIFRPYGL